MEYDFIIALCSFGFCCFSSKIAAKFINPFVAVIVREDEKCRDLRKNIRKLTEEINEISVVDEFARHTRKNRELTKLRSELKSCGTDKTMKQLKIYFAFQVLFYLFAIFVGFYTLYTYHKVALLKFPSSWFYPFNGIMAWPSLTADENESKKLHLWNNFFATPTSKIDCLGPLSAFFMLVIVWNLSRITTVVRPW